MAITNGKDKLIGSSFSNLPQMGEVILSWFQPMTFELVTKTQVDYQTKEDTITIETQGVRQPFTAQQLLIKPEGSVPGGGKQCTVHLRLP
ncbi:hypothetical protein AAIR98_000056 [Elusimicrobium simillimum]|uniref:hypothetical protein n=1 Tax=Elusimicrobium simillimum TaxID=3143438 RepID=UPI003C6F9A62